MLFNSGSRFPAIVDVQVEIGRTGAVVRVILFQLNRGVVVTVRLAICLSCGVRRRLNLRVAVMQSLDCWSFEWSMVVVLI